MSASINSSINLSVSGTPENRDTPSKHSVSRYVLTNFSVFLLLVLGFFSYTINLTYQWGSDDTFHYFLTLQAEKYANQSGLPEQSEGNDFRIYPHYQDLPQAFKSTHPRQDIVADEMMVYETEDSFNYVLAYSSKSELANDQSLIYIEHPYYFFDDEYDVAISIPQLIGLIVICALLVGFLFYLRIAQKLSGEIKRLANWVSQLQSEQAGNKAVEQRNSNQTIEQVNFPFAEFQVVAFEFKSALDAIQQQTEREKNFLKSLSHELRTPLSIIKASLELIEKTAKNLPESVSNKLAKIRAANQSMCDSSDSLLQIWSDSGNPVETRPVDLNKILTVSIQKYQHLVQDKSLSTSLNINPEQLLVPAKFAQIVIDNLIKNAYQYSSDGEIEIQFKNSQLTIVNPLSREPSYTQEPSAPILQEFGYGVGLFVVETICQRMQWHFSTKSSEGMFQVAVDFDQ